MDFESGVSICLDRVGFRITDNYQIKQKISAIGIQIGIGIETIDADPDLK